MSSMDICLHVESREANSLKYHACGLDLEMYYRVCSSAIVSLADNCHRWPPLLAIMQFIPKACQLRHIIGHFSVLCFLLPTSAIDHFCLQITGPIIYFFSNAIDVSILSHLMVAIISHRPFLFANYCVADYLFLAQTQSMFQSSAILWLVVSCHHRPS